jgi:hypothetical protein
LASVLPTRQLGNERVDESVQGRCTGLPENEFLLPTILPPDSSGIVAKLSEQLRRDQPRPGGRAGDVLPTRHAYGHLGWSLSSADGRRRSARSTNRSTNGWTPAFAFHMRCDRIPTADLPARLHFGEDQSDQSQGTSCCAMHSLSRRRSWSFSRSPPPQPYLRTRRTEIAGGPR